MAQYDANSIKTLSPRESIRENLGMYIGGADKTGMHQLFIEAIANSIDEAVAGYGKEIKVIYDTKKNSLSVVDNGRGIPFGKNAEGKDALMEATCNLHGGGKFAGQDGYKSSLGLHGLGLKCIHYLSTYFSVTSERDGKKAVLVFNKDEVAKNEVTSLKTASARGTTITFVPDEEIFGKIAWDADLIAAKMQTYALLNNNVTFTLEVDGKVKAKYCYKDGVKDLLKIKVGDAKCVTNPIFHKCRVVNDDGEAAEFEFGLVYTDSGSEKEYCYANGGETPNGGSYLTGFKSSYTALINKLAKASGIEKPFSGDLVRRGLILVMIMRAEFRLQFEEQTKLCLNSTAARGLASKAVGQWEIEKGVLKDILKKIETEQKAEDAAQRKREAQEKIFHGGKTLNSLRDMPEKLADASDFNGAEIFFVEGDSAAGGAKETKNSKQAVMPLRGKILNTCTKDLGDMIKSPIIKDILTCLGCGIGDNFNIKNLRYDKIIILTDADPDGQHIELLLVTLFLYHLPELIKQGKVYTVASPLYKVIDARKNVLYFYSESEARKWFNTHSGYEVVHIKGLGELNPEELYETSMNPDKRHLIPLVTMDMDKSIALYNQLMGDCAALRREFIMKNKIKNVGDVYEDYGEGE